MYHQVFRGPVQAPSSAALLQDQRFARDHSECRQFRRILLLCQIQKSKVLPRMKPTAVAGNKTGHKKMVALIFNKIVFDKLEIRTKYCRCSSDDVGASSKSMAPCSEARSINLPTAGESKSRPCSSDTVTHP